MHSTLFLNLYLLLNGKKNNEIIPNIIKSVPQERHIFKSNICNTSASVDRIYKFGVPKHHNCIMGVNTKEFQDMITRS